MRLEIHFEAREEFLQAAQFYEAQVPGLGQRFINERCQKALLDTPLIGQSYGRRLRRFTVGDKFPYSIVHVVLADALFVSAYTLHPLTIGSSGRGGCVFGEPRRGLVIGIKQLRWSTMQPRVAQPHR